MENKSINWIFSFTSEENKLTLLAMRKMDRNIFLSHVSQFLTGNPSAKRNAFNIWLKRKGITLEAQKTHQEALIHSDNKQEMELFQNIAKVRSNLSKLTFSGPDKGSDEAYQKHITELKNQKDALEAKLSMLNLTFGIKQKILQIDSEKLAAILPEKSVLIDFAVIRFDENLKSSFKAYGKRESSMAN